MDNRTQPILYLSLQDTSIRDIRKPLNLAEHNEHIYYLKLENNSIKTIAQDTFLSNDVRDLRNFSLHLNSLKLLPTEFFEHFNELLILDLSYNHFENLSSAALTSGKWNLFR